MYNKTYEIFLLWNKEPNEGLKKSIQYGENTANVFDLTFDDFLAFG